MPRHYPNRGKRWTKDEIKQVYRDIAIKELSIITTARKYGRTPAAIVAMMNKKYGLGNTNPLEWDLGK